MQAIEEVGSIFAGVEEDGVANGGAESCVFG